MGQYLAINDQLDEIIAAIEEVSSLNLSEISDTLISIADKMGAYTDPKTWGKIQALVRAGLISRHISVADQLKVLMNESAAAAIAGTGITAATVNTDTFLSVMGDHAGGYVFEYDNNAWHYDGHAVILADYGITATGTPATGDTITITVTASVYDFDADGPDEECPVDANKQHVLPIQMHNVFSLLNFDPPQYLFAVTAAACAAFGWDAATGMPAGTYYLRLLNGAYDAGTNQDGYFKFTTTQAIPVGGGIRHSAIGVYQSSYTKAQILAGTFTTYGANTYTAIESSLATTEYDAENDEATLLGTATAEDPAKKSGDYINFTRRQAYGSNRWSTSYLRQYLNSDDATFVWQPKTIFSRNLNSSVAGFLHSVEPELRAVLGKVRKRYALGQADGYGYEDCEDYVTLATMLDVFGSQNNSISEGPVDAEGSVKRTAATSLWKDSTNADRIKTLSGTARYWWLGSCVPSVCYYVRSVNSSGALNVSSANSSYGVVPRLYII